MTELNATFASNITADNIFDLPWNWSALCPTGLTPWQPNSKNLAPCFLKIILQLPIYTLFAAISSFQCGSLRTAIMRNSTQMFVIQLRIIIAIMLAILPIIEIFYNKSIDITVYPIDILLVCTKCITWIVHLGFLLSLRKYGFHESMGHRGSLVLLVFWAALFVLDCIWVKTVYAFYQSLEPFSIVVVVLNILYLICLIPNGNAVPIRYISRNEHNEHTALLSNRYVQFNIDEDEMILGHAQDEANCCSKLIFYWVELLIKKAKYGRLRDTEDLFELPDSLSIVYLYEEMIMAIFRWKSLFVALHRIFGVEFYLIGILRFIADTAGFAGPLLLGGLISKQDDVKMPYIYALGLFLSTIISAFCSTHFNWRISILGMKMRTAIMTAIYRKTLDASTLTDAKPEILNLMSTDTDRVVNSCISFHTFWSIPFQLITSLYLLYTQIGVAFIAGVCFAAALIPINRSLAVRIQNYSEGLMTAKDKRISAVSETVSSAKQIKIHAWENIFINKINAFRTIELKFLSKRKYLDALCVYFWATTPILMCLLTFGVSVLLGNPLTASTTYTSVALLNMLIGPLNAFPWVINGLVEAWVSLKRIQELLDISPIHYPSLYTAKDENNELSPDSVLEMQQASFSYDNLVESETTSTFELKDVILNIKNGDLVCIDGPVGSGKTTLINAIIAGVNCTKGSILLNRANINEGFGFVSQNPWLQRGTIKENIVWGSHYDESRYNNVIYSCALTEDLENLGGDYVGVGENGRTLSGGQKMRIALARAVYQDKEIYLFDDVLSCVDAHVANHIIKHCILGFLKDKTRIIVTEHKKLLYHANQILNVQNGIVRNASLMSESFDLSDDGLCDDNNQLLKFPKNVRVGSGDGFGVRNTGDNQSEDSILLEESREYGNINTNVIAVYWNAMSTPIALAVVFFIIAMQVTRNLSDIWLAYWVEEANNQNSTIEYSRDFYLGIYAGLAMCNSIITLIRSFMFAYAGIKAAKFIHHHLLNRVMFTKFSFFDITSAGRILNRFSSDTYTVDDSLPFILNIFLAQCVGLIGALFISLYAMPWLALVIVPMIPIYLHLQQQYRCASRDIKRLSSNALSPLYSHFTETLEGLLTIRAMRALLKFQYEFREKLEQSLKAQLTASAAQQWLGLRLQFLGSFLVGGAGFLAAFTSAHETDSSSVGMVISYALSITGLLSGVLNAFVETEQEMIAVERVGQYLQLDEEDNADGSYDPPIWWPSQGSVEFRKAYFSYREHLRPTLLDINLKTAAFERIAIIGRTGAGKTSILSALLRVAPLLSGEINIDCVNVKMLSLKLLREKIASIPQDPFLFKGSVRENLDPLNNYSDSEIWNAITNCLAMPVVQTLGGLNGHLERGGKNLSAGQKQLLCLTRALLKNSKIICIDEGTSNLDSDSEAAIQVALRNSFKKSTIFFVAHRLKSLQHMDRIIVIDSGEIVEQGIPNELAANKDSIFAKMLQEQRNKDYL